MLGVTVCCICNNAGKQLSGKHLNAVQQPPRPTAHRKTKVAKICYNSTPCMRVVAGSHKQRQQRHQPGEARWPTLTRAVRRLHGTITLTHLTHCQAKCTQNITHTHTHLIHTAGQHSQDPPQTPLSSTKTSLLSQGHPTRDKSSHMPSNTNTRLPSSVLNIHKTTPTTSLKTLQPGADCVWKHHNRAPCSTVALHCCRSNRAGPLGRLTKNAHCSQQPPTIKSNLTAARQNNNK